MAKITSNKYNLKYINLETVSYTLESGANKPIVVLGRDIETNSLERFVVKLLASERMSKKAFLNELLGSFIASELELNVPTPAISIISKGFADLCLGNYYYDRILKSEGFNFSTSYMHPNYIWPSDNSLANYENLNLLQNIFIFDVFISSIDRTITKPNMFIFNNDIYIFDHEISFNFIFELSFSRNKSPWILNDSDKQTFQSHVLYSFLKGKEYMSTNFINKLTNLNDYFWSIVKNNIPIEWYDEEQFTTIKENLDSKISHLEQFQSEIINLLK